jgi:uncharacterized protein YneF (UPF0154 family)
MSYQVPAKSDYYCDESTNPIEEICKYTDNLEWIPPELRYQMLSKICRQKGSSVYGQYDAPPNKHIVAQINGERGYFLKKTTTAANIYLIWYHSSKERYMFWGPTERSVRDAMNRIRGRIVKYVVHLDRPSERAEEDVDEHDYVEPVPPTFDEQFGKFSQKRRDKASQIMMKNHPGINEEQAEDMLGYIEASLKYYNKYNEAQAEQDFVTDKAIQIMMKHNPEMDEEQAKNKLNEMVASVVVDYF